MRGGVLPLLLAVTHDHVDAARLLVAQGADPDAVDDPAIADKDGVTALQHARAKGYDEIAALLSR